MLSRRTLLAGLSALPVAGLIAPRAQAAEPEIFSVDGLAIRGTDPVAYFDMAAPQAGSAGHAVMWRGSTWRFASAEAMARFEMNPEAYTPEFGGYCAYAASLGYLAPSVPEAWTIYEDRLYLNASLRARDLWLQDVPGNIAKGRDNWPGILG